MGFNNISNVQKPYKTSLTNHKTTGVFELLDGKKKKRWVIDIRPDWHDTRMCTQHIIL